MQIKLTTNEHQMAQTLLQPVEEQRIRLNQSEFNSLTIEWGEIHLQRGALETLFELFGTLQLAAIPVGVASGILANWLWSQIQKCPENKREKIKIEIVLDEENHSKTISIESESLEKIKQSIKTVLKLSEEPRNGSDQKQEVDR